MTETIRTIVADVGTGFTKVGFSDNFLPSEFSSAIGRTDALTHVGDEALQCPEYDRLSLRALGCDRDTFGNYWQLIWKQIYKVLDVQPEDYPLLILYPPLFPRAFQMTILEIMFEEFSIPAMRSDIDALMSMYSTGNAAGMVVDSGFYGTTVTPIYDGYSLPHAVLSSDTGGQVIDSYCRQIMDVPQYINISEDVSRDIKEKLGTALSPPLKSETVFYQLPDGHKIKIGDERFHFIDPIFDSSLIGSLDSPIQVLLQNSITKCDADIRSMMCDRVVLSGGNTMWPGMASRLQLETKKADCAFDVTVVEHPDRRYNAWIGGAMLASLHSHFSSVLWTKEEYEESGSYICIRRCPY